MRCALPAKVRKQGLSRSGSAPRRGSATVELAIMLPFLSFLFLIAVDWSRIFSYTITLDNCARNAAVFAMDSYDNAQWQGASGQIATAQNVAVAGGAHLNPPLAASGVNVQTGLTDADGNAVIMVTVTYTFKPIAAFPGIPNQTIVRKVQMRVAPATPS